MSSHLWYLALVAAVGLERLAELMVTKRHVAWALSQGGREYGAGHYPFMVVLHTGLLAGCLVEVFAADRPFVPALGWTMLGLVLASQALRWWCIRTLGQRWTTTVIVLPGLPPIRSGPYRFAGHPNYLAVVVEGFALPLVHTAWITAATFSVLNAGLLRIRIRTENRALADAFPGPLTPQPGRRPAAGLR